MAYFDGPKSSTGWYARLEYSYSQSTTATTINLTLKVYNRTGESYNNNNNSAYYIIQGTKTYQKYNFSSIGFYTIGSKTITVTDTSAASVDVSAQWVSGNQTAYTPASLSVSGTVTFPQIKPPVNIITISSIPDYKAGYDGDNVSLRVTAYGGTGYSYKWYRNGAISSTSQTYSWKLSHSEDDNKEVYCLVTDSTGGSATTNICQLRVGISESKVPVASHQIQSVKIYDGSRIVDGISFIKTSTGLLYCNWIVSNRDIDENSNIVEFAVVDKAIAG